MLMMMMTLVVHHNVKGMYFAGIALLLLLFNQICQSQQSDLKILSFWFVRPLSPWNNESLSYVYVHVCIMYVGTNILQVSCLMVLH